jgi:iron(III) transport system permease protein
MFVIVMIGLFVRSRVLRRGNFSVMSGRARSETRVSLGRWRWPARALVLGYIAATAIIPFLALLVVSLQPFWSAKLHLSKSTFVHYRETFFDNVNTQSALKNSILLALVGATITVLVLVLLGLFVHRNKRARGYIVDGVVKFPAAFPQLIMAIALLLAFGPKPFHLSGTLYLLLIGYFVVYVPYGSFIVGSGFTQLGTEFSEASSSCGASPGRTFRRIELPLVMPSVVSGWTLLFVFILSDVTVSSLLTTKNAPVVGFAIVDQYENGSYPTIAALGVVVSMTCALVVFCAQGLSYLRSSRRGTGESRAVLANQSTVMGR